MRHLNPLRVLPVALVLCLFALILFGSSIILRFHDQRHIDKIALSTHDTLCVFKHDLQRRADDTQVYIIELQHGARQPIPGITIADLRRSLAAQRATIDSLSNLDCG